MHAPAFQMQTINEVKSNLDKKTSIYTTPRLYRQIFWGILYFFNS